jgi:acyl-coenzyme A synthetase/AMP-(fatty) acid ligase
VAIEFLTDVFVQNAADECIIWRGERFTYGWLSSQVQHWQSLLTENAIEPGDTVILESDFSPNAVALFLALIEREAIIVPITPSVAHKRDQFVEIARGQVSLTIDATDQVTVRHLGLHGDQELYCTLRSDRHAGLVVFSSGSSGESKAAVHDLTKLLEKFKVHRRKFRSIAFLLFDHLGGLNTMLYSLSNAGCLVLVSDRNPDAVLAAIESHRVDLLPTSPTFLNLVLLSEAYTRHDLSSLKTVTYGTEPMPESTLKRFHRLFPEVQLQQTYGLSEVGVLRSKSKSSGSLWVQIGGEGFETRVVDGILQVKAVSAMLGYLNAPSPFTDDGWFDTGDSVLVDGDYFRILGRDSEMINVGGEKVFPAEVESVIQEMPAVAEVTVYGERNAIVGSIVCAMVRPLGSVDPQAFPLEVKSYCRERLAKFKVPIKVVLQDTRQHNDRFKKSRSGTGVTNSNRT